MSPRALAVVLLLGAPLALQAQAPAAPSAPHRFGWVLEGTIEAGGDPLVEITFTDGSTQTIRTGQGGTASFGVDIRPKALPRVGVRATAGIKFTTTAAENTRMSFTRIPLEVVGSYYLANDWRLGAGLAYHTGINFNGDGFVPDFSLDPAAGATLELGWRWLGVTYTAMEYRGDGGSLDASAIGASLNWVFGKRY